LDEFIQEADYITADGQKEDPGFVMTPEQYVLEEEGTLNPVNGHFLCTPCYIAAGMPSSPTGWVAP